MMQDTDELLGVTLDENERLRAVIAKDEELFNYALERERKLQAALSAAEARLAKAERLLLALRKEIHCADIGDWTLLDNIDAFLLPADKVTP